jgi:hypothetical protein
VPRAEITAIEKQLLIERSSTGITNNSSHLTAGKYCAPIATLCLPLPPTKPNL